MTDQIEPITDERLAEIEGRGPSAARMEADEVFALVARMRAAEEALAEKVLCVCGYGAVCGECHTRDRARADRAEVEAERLRAKLEKALDWSHGIHHVWRDMGVGESLRAALADEEGDRG